MKTIKQKVDRLVEIQDTRKERFPCRLTTTLGRFEGFIITGCSDIHIIGMDQDQRVAYALNLNNGIREEWYIPFKDVINIFVPTSYFDLDV